MRFFMIIVLLIAVIFGIIAFQNNTEIAVNFIKWTPKGHLALVLLAAFAAGLIAGMVTLLPSLWKHARSARTYRKRVEELEQETAGGPEAVEQLEHEDKGEKEAGEPAEEKETADRGSP